MDTTNSKHATIGLTLIRLITLAFFAQIYLSLNLWFPIDRSYPCIPMLPWINIALNEVLTWGFSLLFLTSLVLASTSLKQFRFASLVVALGSLSILVLADVNRFQAWVYIYFVLLSIIAWNERQEQPKKLLVTLQFVLAMVYFWTGFQKLNVQFVTDVYPWLAGIFDVTKPLKPHLFLGYGIGLGEVLLGCFLLFYRTFKLGIILGALLHIGILILLIKDQWNSVVYPWNIAMIGFLFALFWKQEATEHKSILDKELPHYFIIGLFGIVPFLDFFKVVPHCLALGMYSGTSIECSLIFKDEAAESCVPRMLWDDLLYQSDTESNLSLDDWGISDLNVPPFASKYVYTAVARKFCTCAVNYDGYVEFCIPYRWTDKDSIYTIPCKDTFMQPL